MRAPRLLALAAGAALLTGCGLEAGTPYVSVVSGGSFEASEASYYCFEGQDPQAEPDSEDGCAVLSEGAPPVVEASAGETIGIDVPGELADVGWQVSLAPEGPPQQGQEPQRTPIIEGEHYFAFPAGFGQDNAPLRLTVARVAGEGEPPSAVWEFLVVPRV